MAIEVSELRLVWPPELFVAEARALLGTGATVGALGWLMDEAFADGRGYKLLLERRPPPRPLGLVTVAPWDDPLDVRADLQPAPDQQLVRSLARRASDLPRYESPQYYRARRAAAQERRATLAETQRAFTGAVGRLDATGYFEDAFGSYCVDARDDPGAEGQRQLGRLLGLDRPMWPLQREGTPTGVEQGWSEEDLYDVVEALHDLIARPRDRGWHDYGEEWDYRDFSRAAGQAVYRWRVNEILDRSELQVRLATAGQDAGRLVQVAGDDRDQLLQRALTAPDPVNRDTIGHAVALFRARAADREAKRSAIFALVRILEPRRALLLDNLGKKDEGALFRIANEFDIRHSNVKQRPDYDEAYLDWIFWWYLATVELSDRLIARDGAGTS